MSAIEILIVGVSGKRGSGKDTGAEAIFATLKDLGVSEVLRRGYGDALKEECAAFVADRDHGGANYALLDMATDEWRDKILDQSWPQGDETELVSYEDALTAMHDRSKKERYRYLMQWWGTEYRRQQFSDNYWLDKLTEWIDANTAMATLDHRVLVYVPDTRFQNEVAHIQDELGGYLVRVDRPGCEGENDTHQSEIDLDGYTKFNARILNDTTLDDYLANCQRCGFAIASWKWGNAGDPA